MRVKHLTVAAAEGSVLSKLSQREAQDLRSCNDVYEIQWDFVDLDMTDEKGISVEAASSLEFI